ncbi:hypothetical protein NNO_1020 [Hydrogenimonas sp.]|nr:hypothetical protein NNO_1020 [Hydrogenimonas sp.]
MRKVFALTIWLTLLSAAELVRDDSTGIVLDENSGLMWQDDSGAASEKVPWREALKRCENLRLGGYGDWRLPTSDELESLADESRFKHGIYPVFENVGSGGYWSSTQDPVHPSRAWMTLYTCGGGYWYGKDKRAYLRCVRSIGVSGKPGQ